MGNKLYVGNLPYSVRDGDLEQAFGQFGAVTSAKVMMERDTGRSKGFGFVEMGSDAEAQAAINGMNGQPLGGRSVVVNEARPMEARPPRSGGYGGGGGGGYGGGGGGGTAVVVVAVAAVVATAVAAVAAVVVAMAAAAAQRWRRWWWRRRIPQPLRCRSARRWRRRSWWLRRQRQQRLLSSTSRSKKGSPGSLFQWCRYSPRRFLRPRPCTARSNTALGSNLMSLATMPICQGITR